MRSTGRIIVIGAGVGGLATALDLCAAGADVTVLEKEPEVGGKMRRVSAGGSLIDAGPTVLTMRHVFDGLLADAGMRLEDLVTLRPLEILARHSWQDGSRLDLHADAERTADAIGDFAGPEDARGYRRFRDYVRRIWSSVEEPVLGSQRPTFATLVGRVGLTGGLRTLLTIDARRSMWQALGDFFPDPRLRQLFARYATYSGCSALQTPATLNLIAHVESQGAYTVEGGMWQLARGLSEAVRRLGGTVRCGEGVAEILVRGGRAVGVRTDKGEHLMADAVVLNADIAALTAGHFGRGAEQAVKASEVGERSLSAITWAAQAETAGFPLAGHNVFFSRDPADELRALFDDRRVPEDPTVTVVAQDRLAGETRGAGPERLLIVVNAPPNGDAAPLSAEALARLEERMVQTLARHGLDVRMVPDATHTTTPRDFERLFPATGGALYGALAHSWRSTFDRAPSWSRLPGLSLAGGSVHPGAGVPLVAMSGRLCASHVLQELESMSGGRRAVGARGR